MVSRQVSPSPLTERKRHRAVTLRIDARFGQPNKNVKPALIGLGSRNNLLIFKDGSFVSCERSHSIFDFREVSGDAETEGQSAVPPGSFAGNRSFYAHPFGMRRRSPEAPYRDSARALEDGNKTFVNSVQIGVLAAAGHVPSRESVR